MRYDLAPQAAEQRKFDGGCASAAEFQLMDSEARNEAVVREFCAAFARREVDELIGYFVDDATYHNIPLPPAVGLDAIRDTLNMFVPGSPAIEFAILKIAASGSVVFTERIDRMTFNGQAVELPVAGVFELEGGKIRAWRDYFDMQMLFGSAQ